MRIRRVTIQNFRNFQHLDVEVGDHIVLVGENGVGKSNFVYALRLLLDPALSDSQRQLRDEDFWDGIARPLAADAEIRIAVELADFEQVDAHLASLAECLVETDPMVARLTYVFRASGARPTSDEFEFFIFGGDREETRLGYEVRRRLPLDFFHALRDVEADLANWRRSPLRPLLERAWRNVGTEVKQELKEGIDHASEALTSVSDLSELEKTIGDSLERMSGPNVPDVAFGVATNDMARLLRTIRLLLDGGRRAIADASLGLANVIYLTLKLLELRHLVEEGERDHTFLAIEEPEAHLHPHLQRQVFRTFLRLRSHLPGSEGEREMLKAVPTTVLLTTHSPHVASVAPLTSIVLLRRTTVAVPSPARPKAAPATRSSATIGASAATLSITEEAQADLERYIDAMRAEILFAKGVILVEGESELYLVPKIAALHGAPLDRLGISVCPIWGIHFSSYVRLLSALDIPFAVVTDGDPKKGKILGEQRVHRLLSVLLGAERFKRIDPSKLATNVASAGLFHGEATFEVDLARSGRCSLMCTVLAELAVSGKRRDRAKAWKAAGAIADESRFLADIEAIGKGRYAQRLADRLTKQRARPGKDPVQGPRYVLDAIDHVVRRCGK